MPGSVAFNGSTDAIRYAPSPVPLHTVSGFLFYNPGSNSSRNVILSSGGSANGNHYWFLEVDFDGDTDLKLQSRNGAAAGVGVVAENVMTTSKWQGLGFTLESTGDIELFRDGASVATGSIASSSVSTSLNFVSVGALIRNNNALHATGNICEAAVWGNTKLTADQFAKLSTGALSPSDLSPDVYFPLTTDSSGSFVSEGSVDNGTDFAAVSFGSGLTFQDGVAPEAVLNPPSDGGFRTREFRSRAR